MFGLCLIGLSSDSSPGLQECPKKKFSPAMYSPLVALSRPILKKLFEFFFSKKNYFSRISLLKVDYLTFQQAYSCPNRPSGSRDMIVQRWVSPAIFKKLQNFKGLLRPAGWTPPKTKHVHNVRHDR